MIQQRDAEADSPRLHVSFLNREYSGNNGAKNFTVQSTLTNIYDPWSLELPITPDFNDDIPDLSPHRWMPIVFKHADPRVASGKPIPLVMGVCTRCERVTSGDASALHLSGFDMGKLLDSCVRPWVRFRGLTLPGLIDKLIDPSWRRASGPTDSGQLLWGIQGVRGLNENGILKLGQKIQVSSQIYRQNFNKAQGTFIPPVQTEVGETFYDLISRYARLTGYQQSKGSFVNVSADGWIQIFNPDESASDKPLYIFEDHADARNFRIKGSSLILDGEDLYTRYDCFGSNIRPPQQSAVDQISHPNAGRWAGTAKAAALGDSAHPLNRRLTWSDPEQYDQGRAAIRAAWREKQSRYKELGIRLTIQGHSMPGPDGQWRPIVEGNICELNSTRLKRQGRYLIEQVVKRQADAPMGTECDVLLRLPGLLGA